MSNPQIKETYHGRRRPQHVGERLEAGEVVDKDTGTPLSDLMPTAGEKAALPGTSGVPGSTNKYVTNADPRNTDQRDAKSLQGRTIDAAAPAGNDVLTWDAGANKWKPAAGGGGGGTATQLQAVHVKRTTAQSIPNATWTVVAFDAEEFDIGGLHDNVTNNSRLTAQVAGKYAALGVAGFASAGTGIRQARIRKNGADWAYFGGGTTSVTGSGHVIPISCPVLDLVAGDYIELEVYQSSGAALNLDPPRLSMWMVGTTAAWRTSNLFIENDATTPASKVTITADALTIGDVLKSSVNVTADITASGANGLDTGTEAASTWYAVWAIYNPSTDTIAALLSTSFTAPTMPSGYTQKRRVGAIRNDGSSNFLRILQTGDHVLYVDGDSNTVLSAGGATTWTDVNCAAYIPSPGRAGFFRAFVNSTAAVNLQIRTNGTSGGGITPVSQVDASSRQQRNDFHYALDASQIIEYQNTTASGQSYIVVVGYIDPVL